LRLWYLAIATLALLVGTVDRADARGNGSERGVESNRSRAAGEPIIAIVSLHSQRITIYDAHGWILRAPVSSGQRGRETPAGVFSVIKKDADHHSNLYDDAYMPHMQRITWSGIALHGGPLPGYPASHGCVRMPYDFAAGLFDKTHLGMRVIVAPTDVVPIEIVPPALFPSKTADAALAAAAARNAEAEEAARKVDQARLAAGAAFREGLKTMAPMHSAEILKLRAQAQLEAAETALDSATTAEEEDQLDDARRMAAARLLELQVKFEAAKAERQAKLDFVLAARKAIGAAETARTAAAEAASEAARRLEPVSILISRKTQRLYVRQALEPLFDAAVTIEDPDRPIGTHVFTAMEPASTGSNVRWNVVSLETEGKQEAAVEAHARASERAGRNVEVNPPKPDAAKSALDRIVIPQDVLDRIPAMTARSSLIVTDEAVSSETGKGTDFIVLLSDEPQGGIKFRRRGPAADVGYAHARYRSSPFSGPLSTW
jgi:hypothetical protein